MRFHDRQLRIQLSHDEESYRLDEGEPLDIVVRGRRHLLGVDDPVNVSTNRRPDEDAV